ncbi:hypothetical protein [Methylobacterium oryzae]
MVCVIFVPKFDEQVEQPFRRLRFFLHDGEAKPEGELEGRADAAA